MSQLKHLNDQDPWALAEDIPDIDFFFSQIWLSCFVNEFENPSGKAYKKILAIYEGYHLWFYYGEKDSKEVGEHLVEKFINDSKFIKQANEEIINTADELRKFCDNLPETKLDKYSNKDLWNFYNKHDQIHTKYYQWGWLPVAVDMFHSNFTEKLKQHLRSINITEDKVNEYLVLLTQPTKKSLIQIEQEEFLRLAIKISEDKKQQTLFKNLFKEFKEKEIGKYGYLTHGPEYEKLFEEKVEKINDSINKNVYQKIQKHYKKYFYITHMWVGKVSSFEYYLKELARLIGSEENLQQKHDDEQQTFQKTLKARGDLIKKLDIKNKWLDIFNGYGDFMVTKIYRRYAQIFAVYKMEFIQSKIADRLGISLKEIRFMLPAEVKSALLENKINTKEIKLRTKYCVYYAEKNIDKVLIRKEAQRLAQQTKREVDEVSEIQGQTGCIGKGAGKVRIIIRPQDMGKMKEGDVLVSIATDPDIVPAMKKAAAIVTEQGGVTSHAAIVSRELNIPCVIGTKVATKVFKDGDMVEVDANKGTVKKV